MVKSKLEQGIIDALEQVAPEHGIDIVDVELAGATKGPCVRVRLERVDGTSLTLDDVTAQNAWVSACIEELDPVPGSYTLEVSSPGMARPLRRPRDFVRFTGEDCELTTMAIEGRRRWSGRIAAADEEHVELELEDGTRQPIAYTDIKKCVLKPVYNFKSVKEGN